MAGTVGGAGCWASIVSAFSQCGGGGGTTHVNLSCAEIFTNIICCRTCSCDTQTNIHIEGGSHYQADDITHMNREKDDAVAKPPPVQTARKVMQYAPSAQVESVSPDGTDDFQSARSVPID